jgi:putative membrane protein
LTVDQNQAGPPEPRRPAGHATDHLANERTFLAWIRTALGLVGIGFVLARMGLFLRQLAMIGGATPGPSARGSHEFLITGVLFLLLGTAVTLGSGWLYHRARESIDAGSYEPPRHAITALMVVVVAGSLTITGLLLWQVVTLGVE